MILLPELQEKKSANFDMNKVLQHMYENHPLSRSLQHLADTDEE